MTNFYKIIRACEGYVGEGKKAFIAEQLSQFDEYAHKLCYLALSAYEVFHLKKFTPKAQFAVEDASPELVIEVLRKLVAREITGNAARDAWADVLTQYTKPTAEILNRVLDKNLRAGFSADTYNEIWPERKIPTFEVMLADVCKTPEEYFDRIPYPAWAAIKYDGQRTIAMVTKDGVEYRSRSGKPASHLNGLFDKELMLMHSYLGSDFVADGETDGANFTETQNAKKEGNDEAKANLKLRLFAIIPMVDWLNQKTEITMDKNLENCMNVLNAVSSKWDDNDGPRKIILEEGKIVNNYDEQVEYCNHVIDNLKQEGLIVKTLNKPYVWERSYTWVKVKRMYPADLAIVGFYSGKKNTRLANTLGGVIAAGYLDDGRFVVTDVGSGFSDELRTKIWNNKVDYLGAVIEVQYQEVTRAKDSDVDSLRFGVFKHFRDDKNVVFTEEHQKIIDGVVNKK